MATTLGIGRVIDSQQLQSKIADIGAILDGHTVTGLVTPLTIATTPVTATAAQFINGVINITIANSTTALTTPTAAAIVAAIVGVQVGTAFWVNLLNIGSGTATWTLGTGVTALGLTTVATNKAVVLRGVVTNVTAGTEAVFLQQTTFAAA